MKKVFLLIAVVMSLVSCSQAPSEAAIQTAIAETNSVLPTSTSSPTISPSATFTFTLTNTLTPTITPTSTFTLTSTATDTATPIPPEVLTQQAVDATQTEKAANITSTQKAFDTIRTEQAAILTSTKKAVDKNSTATAQVKTQTKEAVNKTATEVASYESIYWKELATYPENYIGQRVVVNGRVFNVLGKVIQMYFSGTYEALYVNLKKTASGVYDNSYITVYGVVKGKECFKNAYGAEICQPALKDAWYTIP